MVSTISGDVPHVTCGLIAAASSGHHAIELGARIADQGAPVGDRPIPQIALRCERAPAQVVDGRIVHRHHAGARAGLDGHVAHGHAPFHRLSERIALPAELDRVAGPPGGTDLTDHGQRDVLGGDAARQPALHLHQHGLGLLHAPEHCVASTCSTSEVPMPNARQANAPCVLVCESPHTTVMPGSVAPCSGPITCTMPWRASRKGK